MSTDLIDRLTSEGWRQQFTASGEKLTESIRNYEWLGFEVKTVPLKELGCEDCSVCFDDESDDSVMIFTRKKQNPGSDDPLAGSG
jgi:hypothetical protein